MFCPFCLSTPKHKKHCPRTNPAVKEKTPEEQVVELNEEITKLKIDVTDWRNAWHETRILVGQEFWKIPYIGYKFGNCEIDPDDINELNLSLIYLKGFFKLMEGFFRICSLDFNHFN